MSHPRSKSSAALLWECRISGNCNCSKSCSCYIILSDTILSHITHRRIHLVLHPSRTALVLNSDCKFFIYLSFILILHPVCYILVMLDFQWISVPTSSYCLWCTGSIASTAGWAVWIIYSCWKNYSSEFATAYNDRCKERNYRHSMWILVGWSACNGCLLYSQVRRYAAAACSVSKKVAFILCVCVCVHMRACVRAHACVRAAVIYLWGYSN